MVFTLHYAHLYYRRKGGGDQGGLDVPGTKEPGYWDFLYFSFTIGVAARCQKQGLGARLLRHAMTVGKAARARRVLLEVRRSNASALGLYQHFGFRQVGVRKGYYPADGGREDALVLERDLEDVTA